MKRVLLPALSTMFGFFVAVSQAARETLAELDKLTLDPETARAVTTLRQKMQSPEGFPNRTLK